MMYRRPVLAAGLGLLVLAAIVAVLRESRRGERLGPGPERAGGRVERCLSCHHEPEASPGGAHAADALGCSACHLGNPLAYDAERAHAGMEAEPGALETVERTCGRPECHRREAVAVAGSLMATLRGMVAVNRWVFGEIPYPSGSETLADVLAQPTPTPAQGHLRKLCAGCHLHARAGNRDDAVTSGGSGCSACHFSGVGTEKGRHPPVDSRVSDDRCQGCHSGSARIALSYRGLAEVKVEQLPSCKEPASLHDDRPACRALPDVHQARGLACVDCHLHTDLMGDGTERLHKEDQVEITCESCHGPFPAGSLSPVWAQVDDPVTRDILRRTGESRPPLEPVRLGRRGTPVWNLRPSPEAGAFVLGGKLDGRAHPVRPTPVDANHLLPGHERLTCSACHAAWAPSCTTCHTGFDPSGRQWDFGAARETEGRWVEESESFGSCPPALAVDGRNRIVPAVPGMILTIGTGGKPESAATRRVRAGGAPVRLADRATYAGGTGGRPPGQASGDPEPGGPEPPASRRRIPGEGQPVSRRLFAPIEPHTTQKQARSCSSCHLSSVALGLGSGRLDLTADEPAFVPAEPTPDGLARDAWTRLGSAAIGTRRGVRSLDGPEQRRVLEVGRCVPCHDQAKDPIYRDFGASVRLRREPGSRCRM